MSKGAANEFSDIIRRLSQSRAYLDFCEQAYGYRAYLFNMMDKEQLDYVLHSLPLGPNDTVLDLGCGNGSLLELIVAQYGCAAIGLDLLDNSPAQQNDKLRYICGDIDDIAAYGLSPTLTLCVDSLYFSRDLDRLARELAHIPGNRLYLFYSQYLFDAAEDVSLLQSDRTRLAQALAKAGVAFRTQDFSENERRLYLRMEQALQQLQPAFAAEGNADLQAKRLAEARRGLELFAQGRASRYLYICENIRNTGR